MPRQEVLVLSLIFRKENIAKFRKEGSMNKSEKLNYIPFSPGGFTSCFPPLFIFFPSCLHTALEGQHLGQDGHELCV